jgi:hypothetical protein
MASALLNSAANTMRRITIPIPCRVHDVTWKNDLISGKVSFMITVRILPRLEAIKTDLDPSASRSGRREWVSLVLGHRHRLDEAQLQSADTAARQGWWGGHDA